MGCGRTAPKRELLRIVAQGPPSAPLAVADRSARLPGRGAYLCRAGDGAHAEASCLKLAQRRNALARALRAAVSVSPELVESIGE